MVVFGGQVFWEGWQMSGHMPTAANQSLTASAVGQLMRFYRKKTCFRDKRRPAVAWSLDDGRTSYRQHVRHSCENWCRGVRLGWPINWEWRWRAVSRRRWSLADLSEWEFACEIIWVWHCELTGHAPARSVSNVQLVTSEFTPQAAKRYFLPMTIAVLSDD